MANRTREKLRPKEPRDLTFEIVDDHVPENFLRLDIQRKGQRHLIFATNRQLRILGTCRQWFLDGTFKIVRSPFHQLLSIHAFIRSGSDVKMLPLVFVLMSRRQTSDYIAVFRGLLSMMPSTSVQTITLDFEMAAWKALTKVLPETKLRGCLFHHTQAVYRKILELGLSVANRTNDKTHKFLRKLMALPFLPATDIPRIFQKIADRIQPGGQLYQLVQYFRRQWILHSTFVPRSWSVYQVAVRTNNFVEGWHRRMNNKAGERRLGVYQLVDVLHKDAMLVPLQTRLAEEGKPRAYARRTSKNRQEEVFRAWREYKAGELSIIQLLTRCAAVHGPVIV